MPSVYVVCWIFLQTFQTYFCILANSVDPDQTAPTLIWVHTVYKNDFKSHKQMTKQTTIVVIGSLRVKMTFSNIFYYFSEKIKLDSSYEFSARQTIHTNCKAIFTQKNKKKRRMSSAALGWHSGDWHFKVKNWLLFMLMFAH